MTLSIVEKSRSVKVFVGAGSPVGARRGEGRVWVALGVADAADAPRLFIAGRSVPLVGAECFT